MHGRISDGFSARFEYLKYFSLDLFLEEERLQKNNLQFEQINTFSKVYEAGMVA